MCWYGEGVIIIIIPNFKRKTNPVNMCNRYKFYKHMNRNWLCIFIRLGWLNDGDEDGRPLASPRWIAIRVDWIILGLTPFYFDFDYVLCQFVTPSIRWWHKNSSPPRLRLPAHHHEPCCFDIIIISLTKTRALKSILYDLFYPVQWPDYSLWWWHTLHRLSPLFSVKGCTIVGDILRFLWNVTRVKRSKLRVHGSVNISLAHRRSFESISQCCIVVLKLKTMANLSLVTFFGESAL